MRSGERSNLRQPNSMSYTPPIGVPKTSEWGPLLWCMLHGAIEKMGFTPVKSILEDQRREFISILRFVEGIMPCPLCRNHYHEYRAKNPIDKLPVDPLEFKAAARKWLFDLHEDVNKRNHSSWEIYLEQLPERYSSVDVNTKSQELYNLLDSALRIRLIEGESYKKFKTHYKLYLRYCM